MENDDLWLTHKEKHYTISVLVGAEDLEDDDHNFDVTVTFSDGKRYGATYFSLNNIKILFDRYKTSGECGGGLYVWGVDMIIVDRMCMDTIIRSVASLLTEREFYSAFKPLSDGVRPK